MKRKYIKPTTEVFASIVQPIMAGSGIDNSDQSRDGGAGARGTDFLVDDESEDSRYNLWEE